LIFLREHERSVNEGVRQVMFNTHGVQKFNPDIFPLLKALASVETTVATAWISSSSNAAPIKIG
jgi:hypothetical protein